MIKRHLLPKIIDLAKQFPVITILGPRQAGKTTLAKQAFPDYLYCNLEHPETRELAQEDPKAFFKKYSEKVIIDEIQRVPQLLSYIQVMVDEKKMLGRFILTGSHQLQLSQEVSQSLAGRTAITHLLPLSMSELRDHGISFDHFSEYIFQGFYPRIYDDQLNPTDVLRSYYMTYVEKDVRQIISLKDLSHFEKFMKLLASRVGSEINFQSLSNDVGVSSATIKNWLSVLEASHLVFSLTPYFENFGKRVIKSPKIYFTDVGLLSYLLGIESADQVQRDPLVGGLFENLVIIEFLKHQYNLGASFNGWFYRAISGVEIDLLIQKKRKLIPIEIKSASTYQKSFQKNLNLFKKIYPHDVQSYIIFSGESLDLSGEVYLRHFSELDEILKNH